jgi:hypothetical protein
MLAHCDPEGVRVELELRLAIEQALLLGVAPSQRVDAVLEVAVFGDAEIDEEEMVAAPVQRQREAREALLPVEDEIVRRGAV